MKGTTMDSALVALLGQITDPTPGALADLRETVEILASAIARLEKAENKKGEDQQDYLWYLVNEARDQLEVLEEALGRP